MSRAPRHLRARRSPLQVENLETRNLTSSLSTLTPTAPPPGYLLAPVAQVSLHKHSGAESQTQIIAILIGL